MKSNSEPTDSPVASIKTEAEPFRLTIALMDEIKNIAESNGSKFMIVSTERWWNHPSAATYKDFVSTMQSEGFLVLDVESMPGFDPEEMLIPNDGHWNQSGNAFVAAKISELIATHQLLGQSQK